MRYDIFVTVWGQTFTEKFIRYSVKSQLFPGNLPALSLKSDINYHIYTDKESKIIFDPIIKELNKYVQVKFHYFEDIMYKGANLKEVVLNSDVQTVKHNVQRLTSQHMLSDKNVIAAILLDSDFILADGCLTRMHELREKGYHAVITSLTRLNEDSVSSLLTDFLQNPIESADLVKMCLDHMHPIYSGYFMGSDSNSEYPVQLNWPVVTTNIGKTNLVGFIVRCIFPHPLLVIPDKNKGSAARKYFSTMDYDYVFRAIGDNNKIYLSQSSEEILISKLTKETYAPANNEYHKVTIDRMANFILYNSNRRHSFFLNKPIYFLCEKDGNWDEINKKAQKFIENVEKTIECKINISRASDPKSLIQLKSYLGSIEDFNSPQILDRMNRWMTD
ncbi:MAG: hypothetical protein CMM67_07205 [Rhodospirillaceae bacterium]|mgnify:CR=1 FL=1|nr:hypothetical protein [Rhodospirillaceae bacterium]OUT78363.1 MAG: hypothetical protein CBB83_07390 [Rhodospirillaceae bacterium TMED23]|tara:strand:+ start:135 stop:1301 length:1167 start_codon:yes stop_codon:yes gene_type:complete